MLAIANTSAGPATSTASIPGKAVITTRWVGVVSMTPGSALASTSAMAKKCQIRTFVVLWSASDVRNCQKYVIADVPMVGEAWSQKAKRGETTVARKRPAFEPGNQRTERRDSERGVPMPISVDSDTEVVDFPARASALAEKIEARVDQAAAAATLTPDVVEALESSDFFRMGLPRV